MIEAEGYGGKENELGIFVDIFRVDGAAPTKIGRYWQYFCAKYRTAYLINQRGYNSASLLKKIVMFLSFPQKFKLSAIFSNMKKKNMMVKKQVIMDFYLNIQK
ncbi:hypothetical protein [Prevotella disiens]|uniref:hypothetical protein n=1 Tax=Prevotella disiens TaxID=28130 RepID=UPI00216B580D|nr:hypothetical protein [Prevotella disiens]